MNLRSRTRSTWTFRWSLYLAAFGMCTIADAQLTDVEQTPNEVNEGIQKSFQEQVGPGRGDVNLPGSSLFLIKRDPFRSIRRGRQLFQRKFTVEQGLGPRTQDGVGDIHIDPTIGAGLGDSCAACHGRPRGSAGFGGDVFTRPDSRDAPHLFGLGLTEMLADEITMDLRAIQNKATQKAAQRQRPITLNLRSKGVRYGKITAFPDGTVDTSRVRGVNPDLRVRPFFHHGGTISIREFIVGALNAEMGLEAADPDLIAAVQGSDVETPSGMVLRGSTDQIESPPVQHEFDDADLDGVTNEIPVAAVDHLEFYLLNYFRPATYQQTSQTSQGAIVFESIGCAKCHIPDLQIDRDRRVADVQTGYDDTRGVFNRLFATAEARFEEQSDGSSFFPLKTASNKPFLVKGIYADFKRHDLGPTFWERQFDGSIQKQFMTEPLWGVGSTAPYGHDGRSINLDAVIRRHGGEARRAQQRYLTRSTKDREALLAFLGSLVLFPPDDTASNLNPANPDAENFPQNGHGSIKLSELFNDPNDPE